MANQIGAPFAGFLSADDLSAGQRASNADVNNKINQFQAGYEIGGKIKNAKIADVAAAEQKQQIEMGRVVEAAKWGSMETPTPQVAAPQAQAPVATPAPRVVQESAPAISFPVVPTPSQMTPAQPASPQYTQAPAAPKASQPETLATVVTPTPAVSTAPIAPAAQAAPATAAPATVAQPLDAGEAVRAKLKTVTTEAADKDQAILQNLVQSGKITPDFAQRYAANAAAIREKAADRVIETETKIAAIVDKDLDSKKKRVEIAKTVRDAEDNSYHDVYSALQRGGIQAAKMTAKELGIEVDLSDPKGLAMVENRAKRSSDFKEVQARQLEVNKDQREAAKDKREDRVKWAFDKDTGLATGVDPVTGNSVIRDENGKAITTAEYRALDVNQRSAIARAGRAVSGSGAGGANPSAGASGNPGEISGLKRDKQGNITVDPTIVKQLGPAAKAYDVGTRILSDMKAIENDGLLSKASASGIGSKISGVQQLLGVPTERREADERLARFATSALGVIESPLMKGAPSEADARRSLGVINDPKSSRATKKEAMESLKTTIEAAQQQHREAVGQYDAPTKARLKGLGINADTGEKPEAAPKPAASSLPSPAEFDAAWAKAARGAIVKGPDGKSYVKK